MEENKQRLIDANALLEEMRNILSSLDSDKHFETRFGVRKCIELAYSAPTVETTDVANKFFVEFMQSLKPGEQMMSAGTAGRFIEYVQKKKLEASLNPK